MDVKKIYIGIMILMLFSCVSASKFTVNNFNATGTGYFNNITSYNDVCIEGGNCLSSIEGTTYTSNLNFSNGANYWNDTWAGFNKTYADTLYASISVTGDNSSWNQSYADTLYAPINYGDDWNKTYADTLYADIGVTGDNSSWNESYADTKYALIGAGSDNSSWNESYANTLYRLQSWDNFTGIPTATPSDNDTTHFSTADQIYDWVSDLLLGVLGNYYQKTEIDEQEEMETIWGVSLTTDSELNSGLQAQDDTLELTNGAGFITNFTMNKTVSCTDIVGGPDGDFCTDSGGTEYTSNLNFTNDANYWNDTYATFNKTYADTLYASISITGDNSSWNESYADTLYADISVTGGNSSWNESYANTLYAPINYGDDWNKTYADTLYADIGVTGDNSSWNESYADTLYADISVTDTNETTRFNNLIGNCSSDEVMFGIDSTGNKVCITDQTGETGGNPFDQTLNTTDSPTFHYLHLGNNTEANSYLYFYQGGSPTGESIMWNDGSSRFDVSDDWYITGSLRTSLGIYSVDNIYTASDIYTSGIGGDLWLGTSTQSSADFRAYANGSMNAIDGTFANNVSATYFIGDGSQLTGIEGSAGNTTEQMQDAVLGGANITIDYDDTGDEWGINITWLTSWINTWLGTKTTDDITQGSTNLYDNKSWNQSFADTLYADISVTGDNSTWNESYADTKYLQSYTETDPLWNGNVSNVAFTNVEETFSGNVTVEGIKLEADSTNHRIYDNSTCTIITGDTSTLYIC